MPQRKLTLDKAQPKRDLPVVKLGNKFTDLVVGNATAGRKSVINPLEPDHRS